MNRLIFLFAALSVISNAQAYIDPGAGSLFAQILLGGFAGLIIAFKIYWKKISALFGRPTSPDSAPQGEIEALNNSRTEVSPESGQ